MKWSDDSVGFQLCSKQKMCALVAGHRSIFNSPNFTNVENTILLTVLEDGANGSAKEVNAFLLDKSLSLIDRECFVIWICSTIPYLQLPLQRPFLPKVYDHILFRKVEEADFVDALSYICRYELGKGHRITGLIVGD